MKENEKVPAFLLVLDSLYSPLPRVEPPTMTLPTKYARTIENSWLSKWIVSKVSPRECDCVD